MRDGLVAIEGRAGTNTGARSPRGTQLQTVSSVELAGPLRENGDSLSDHPTNSRRLFELHPENPGVAGVRQQAGLSTSPLPKRHPDGDVGPQSHGSRFLRRDGLATEEASLANTPANFFWSGGLVVWR